ncbi:HD domain-containing protein [Candidatus Dojkabacteria bacterium]|uniref:HD domain-containing protein n=1 Tax=Candidatus Dojkabacteria bacterium TaxID=2099670 RepID=A0A955RJY1_9BACT|nr:HD domain-containing protein [Candidatus Dojkabacteria bacterium]
MKISDRVYGEFIIDSPIISGIIELPTFERLKDISQAGVPTEYNSLPSYSRYEHSIGVYILLNKLGASLEEQIAGLLHDIAHLVFSHVAEWVFAENNEFSESSNEDLTDKFIDGTDIGDYLEANNISKETIIDFKKFSLLEQPMPFLCADRVDYAFRDGKYWNVYSELPNELVTDLKSHSGHMAFQDRHYARRFADIFLTLQNDYWGGYDAVFRYYHFSELLKLLLKKGILTRSNFFKGESSVLRKIKACKDSDVINYTKVLKEKDLTKYKGTYKQNIKKKFRYVDPEIILENKLVPLSEIDNDFLEKVNYYKAENEKGIDI